MYADDTTYKERLLELIDNVLRYGLERNLNSKKNQAKLQIDLLKIYTFYLSNDHFIDDFEAPDFDITEFHYLSENIQHNFSDLTYFKTFEDIHNMADMLDIVTVDSRECLTEIMFDLLETKWRINEFSTLNGRDFFNSIFEIKTEQNILNLLHYLKQK